MKLLGLAVMSVLCTLNQALMLPTVATVSLMLFGLNKPVSCFFGVYRRRSSPIQEVFVSEPEFPFAFVNQPMTERINPYTFGAGNYFLPGFAAPSFTMLLNRYPPTSSPAPQVRIPPSKRDVPSEVLPVISSSTPIPEELPHHVPSDAAYSDPKAEFEKLSTEEMESFFSIIAETDVGKCVARFICEVGANPESGGAFGRTIFEILASLNDFPDGSQVSEYHELLTLGMVEGISACTSKFPMCDDESLSLVKSA